MLSISQPVTENYLRTINDLCDMFLDYPHPFVDGTRGPRSGHPSFLLRQYKGSYHSNSSSLYHVPHTPRKKSPWNERAPHSIANDTQVYSTQPVPERKHDCHRRRVRSAFLARNDPVRRSGVSK
jgi:hypothetical protein